MAEPKKETVQISLASGPQQAGPAPSVPKRDAIPIVLPMRPPSVLPQPAPAVIPSRLVTPVDAIPPPVCWALLGISTLIFLIQIWNYVVS